MRNKLIGFLALAVFFIGFSSFVADDEGGVGSGFGYSTSTIECPRDQWAMVASSANSSSGASGSVYVNQGSTIPGTNVVAGVSGYYTSANINAYSNLRETYKDTCVKASWYNYCSIVSCRVKFD